MVGSFATRQECRVPVVGGCGDHSGRKATPERSQGLGRAVSEPDHGGRILHPPWDKLCPCLEIASSLVGKWLVPAGEFFVPAWEFEVSSVAI